MKAIDIIERARSYYLLPKDHADTGIRPTLIGSRIKLEYALENVNSDMIIATSGNDKKCVVLVDFTTEEVLMLAHRGDQGMLRLKNGKN